MECKTEVKRLLYTVDKDREEGWGIRRRQFFTRKEGRIAKLDRSRIQSYL